MCLHHKNNLFFLNLKKNKFHVLWFCVNINVEKSPKGMNTFYRHDMSVRIKCLWDSPGWDERPFGFEEWPISELPTALHTPWNPNPFFVILKMKLAFILFMILFRETWCLVSMLLQHVASVPHFPSKMIYIFFDTLFWYTSDAFVLRLDYLSFLIIPVSGIFRSIKINNRF